MPRKATDILRRQVTRFMVDNALVTLQDASTVTDPYVKVEIRVSTVGLSPREQQQAMSVQRGTMYARWDAIERQGMTATVNGVTWFVVDDDSAATERAALKLSIMRDMTPPESTRQVTLYRLQADGSDVVVGPLDVTVLYTNRQAREDASPTQRTRRVDATLSGGDTFTARAGDLFRLDMGGGMYLGGEVIDVNRSGGGVTADVIVLRGNATPARREGDG